MQQIDSEKLFRKLILNMNEAVWLGDKDENTIYANPKFCEMMGYKLEEIISEKSYIFWDDESIEKVKNINSAKRKKGFSSSYEGNLLTKDGKKIPVLISGTPLINENGEFEGTIGIMTNLQVLKEKEKSEKILQNAIEYATDAIIIFDKKGKIQSWNKGAKLIFGYKKSEILNSNLNKIILKTEADLILENTKILHKVEIDGISKNKRLIKIAATISPILENNGNFSSCLMIARDIIEQAKFEEEIAIKYQKIKSVYNKLGILRRQMDYLFDFLELSVENRDQKTIADFIVSSVIMLTRVDACVLRIYNEKKDTLDMLSSFGVHEDWKGKSSIKCKNSLAQKAFKSNMSLKIIDISRENKYQSVFLAKKNNLSSLLLIPLKFRSKLIGSLSLYVTPDKKLAIFENDFIEKYTKLIELTIGSTMFG